MRNHDAVKLIGWTALGYAWRIAGSLLQIIFVLYIFSRLEDRFDTIVVAISGLIYVSILSIDLYFIQKRIGDDISEPEQEGRAVESKKPHAMFLAAIPGFGFFVIGLVSVYTTSSMPFRSICQTATRPSLAGLSSIDQQTRIRGVGAQRFPPKKKSPHQQRWGDLVNPRIRYPGEEKPSDLAFGHNGRRSFSFTLADRVFPLADWRHDRRRRRRRRPPQIGRECLSGLYNSQS